MSISAHKVKIRNRIRKEQIDKYMSQARQELWLARQEKVFTGNENNQDELLNCLEGHLKRGEELKVQNIYYYILTTKDEFKQHFLTTFVSLVCQHFRTNELMLASLRCLFKKSSNFAFMQSFDAKIFFEQVLTENWNEQQKKLDYLDTIIDLFTVMLKKVPVQPETLTFIISKLNQNKILDQFDERYIRLITLGIRKRLIPDQSTVIKYLQHASKSQNNQNLLGQTCYLLSQYLKASKHVFDLFVKVSSWVQSILLQGCKPAVTSRMIELIQVLFEQNPEKNPNQNIFLPIFEELCPLISSMQADLKMRVYYILSIFLERAQMGLRVAFISHLNLFQVVMNGIKEGDRIELTIELLEILVLILQAGSFYEQAALEQGIESILTQYMLSPNQKLAYMAEMILQVLDCV